MASNPRTFIDVTVDGQPLGRVVFELFADAVPKTAENFRSLSTGERGTSQTSGKPLHYKGAPLHRVIDGFMIQGGDTTHGNGKGGESIYGSPFADENLDTPVDKAGLLVMANRGPNTNSSQFFITLADAPHLNGKHVVFGRVVGGMQHIEAIGKLDVDPKDRPLQPVIIAHCGELERRKPAPVRPRSASRSVSASGSSSSDEPRRKKRKHRTEEEKAAKRAKKEAKRARKEAKRAKKLKRQDGSDTDEPGPVSAEEAARKAAEEEAQRQQREKERARLDEERKRELERLKNRLAAPGKQAASVAYRGRGEMRFREGGSGMHGW